MLTRDGHDVDIDGQCWATCRGCFHEAERMNIEKATAVAADEAARYGLRMAVYRMPGWTEGEYGVRQLGRLPDKATVATIAEPAVVVTTAAEEARAAETGVTTNRGATQRSLFGD